MPKRQLNVKKPAFVTHSKKTAAEVREAMAWLKSHGFEGHFSNVPPEVLDDFEEIDVSCGPYGFYLSTEGDVHLFEPMWLEELTDKQRQKIHEKFGMSAEEVIRQEREKFAEEMAKRRGPLSQEEADAAFEVSGRLRDNREYMWPEVSSYALSGLKCEEFDDRIHIVFTTRDDLPMMPGRAVAIVAKPPAVSDLVRRLRAALG